MKSNEIRDIRAFPVPPRWLFVRVETSGGACGWGEATLEGHCAAVEVALDSLRSRLIGVDPSRIEDIWQVGYRGGFYRGGPVLMSALSGLDQALWDLKGKVLGVPVWQLLGGRVRDKVSCYAWIGGDRPQVVEDHARRRFEQSFRAVKMNATAELGYIESTEFVDGVVERVRLAQACGLSVAVDAHGRLHRAGLGALLEALGPVRPLFIEEPVLSEHLESLRGLDCHGVPVALGERLYSRWDFRPVLESGLVDIAQPDVSHAGGISEVRRIAAMAETYDVAVAPHSPLGPLALAACLQIAGSTPNVVLQEVSLGIHYNQGADLLSYVANPEVFDVDQGYVKIPDGVGLGVDIDEAKVEAAAREGHKWSNPVWRLGDGSFAEW